MLYKTSFESNSLRQKLVPQTTVRRGRFIFFFQNMKNGAKANRRLSAVIERIRRGLLDSGWSMTAVNNWRRWNGAGRPFIFPPDEKGVRLLILRPLAGQLLNCCSQSADKNLAMPFSSAWWRSDEMQVARRTLDGWPPESTPQGRMRLLTSGNFLDEKLRASI